MCNRWLHASMLVWWFAVVDTKGEAVFFEHTTASACRAHHHYIEYRMARLPVKLTTCWGSGARDTQPVVVLEGAA